MVDRLRARLNAWSYRVGLWRRSGDMVEFEALLTVALAAFGLAVALVVIAGVRFDWWE